MYRRHGTRQPKAGLVEDHTSAISMNEFGQVKQQTARDRCRDRCRDRSCSRSTLAMSASSLYFDDIIKHCSQVKRCCTRFASRTPSVFLSFSFRPPPTPLLAFFLYSTLSFPLFFPGRKERKKENRQTKGGWEDRENSEYLRGNRHFFQRRLGEGRLRRGATHTEHIWSATTSLPSWHSSCSSPR